MKNIRAFYVLLAVFLITFLLLTQDKPNAIFVILFSLSLTLTILYGIAKYLSNKGLHHGVLDFLVGDEGSLSLSRFQAVLWGIVILSSQIAVIVTLIVFHDDGLRYFELEFSESSIWLLGLSLTSYVSVKGISVNTINQQPQAFKSRQPQKSDLITGANGLDFSKCQMLIWTLIGIGIFYVNVYYFLECLKVADVDTISLLFRNHYEEYTSDGVRQDVLCNNAPLPFLPYLPWTFVVLMGLSQGAYVGKKLVPSFKLDDLKEAKELELEEEKAQLEIKKSHLVSLSNLSKGTMLSEIDKENQKTIEKEIVLTQRKIQELDGTIGDIQILKGQRL